uniref:Alpha-1,3-mannosyl-glycoprotein 2-beta-N-acetylglucosaminyltransferase n=1 Tax=Enterobius vermicularis TaxID=51028 RepID=A0A0N4VFH1_ENTVE
LIIYFQQPVVDYSNLEAKIEHLEKLLARSNDHIIRLRNEVAEANENYKAAVSKLTDTKGEQRTSDEDQEKIDPIPVLVFVCNRPRALKQHVDKLLNLVIFRYRPNAENYPIIISQDCDNNEVAEIAQGYGSSVQYIKHLSGDKANITVASGHQRYLTYYMIARHYKLGLTHVFNRLNYSSVIITEDDLDIAPDFFEYFRATRRLLDKDPTLYCVSAWNDNGKSNLIDSDATDLLYRSDFFPGLGWMMTKTLWDELGPIWPNGFWDDWIRDPLRRKNRACIRPEISRTAMTKEGRKGASKGLFFTKHLAKIQLNTQPANFSGRSMEYLIKKNYDEPFLDSVYSASVTNLPSLRRLILEASPGDYRIEYTTLSDYLSIADSLQIMRDFKAGVPRTAYFGIVTCFINRMRIYVAPDRFTWSGYNQSWEAPDNPHDLAQL